MAAPDPREAAALEAPVITVEIGNQPTLSSAAAISGTATLGGQPFARKKLDVSRTGPDGKVELASLTTGQDGTFTFSDLAAARGNHVYVVRYPGDNQIGAAEGSATTYVTGNAFAVTFDTAPEVIAGEPLVVSGVARSGGAPLGGAKLTAAHSSEADPDYASLGEVTTDASGAFKVTVPAATAGWHDVRVAFAGDRVTEPGSATLRGRAKHAVALTFDPVGDVVAGDPIVVSGVLTASGSPVSGAKLAAQHRSESKPDFVSLGDVTTDAAGRFTLTVSDSSAGWHDVQFAYAGDDRHRPLTGTQRVQSTKAVVALTLSAAADVVAGQPIVVSGLLTRNGAPLAGTELAAEHRSESSPSFVAIGKVVTDSEGRFSVTAPNSVAGWHDIKVSYSGDANHDPVSATQRVQAHQYDSTLTFDPAAGVPAGGTVLVTGVLKRSGSPLANADLAAQHRSERAPVFVSLGKVTTDANGFFSVAVPNAAPGWHDIRVSYTAADTKPASGTQRVQVAKYDVDLTFTGPDRLPASAAPTTFTGTLKTAAGAPVAGAKIQISRQQGQGGAVQRLTGATTDAAGRYTFKHSESRRWPVRYQLTYVGTATHNGGSVERLWKGTPPLPITTDKRIYTYGDLSAVTVTASERISAASFRVLWTAAGSSPQKVSTAGANPSSKTFTFTRKAVRNATITASTSETAYWRPGSSTRQILVKPKLTTTLAGAYGTEGSLSLVRTTTDPVLRATVGPNRAGRCVYARVETIVDGIWKPFRTSTCVRLTSHSQAAWRLKITPQPGVRFRLRFESRTDSMNVAANGQWVTLRFTR
ncbi:hypothetical protein [Nocardioides speluncae]|uniref:hypothetical protein n=1 Tax=Nocardioides speluncae TaxID=2670337 RepID=UPI000D69D7F6|nr:hypothetical protein [Nocardioides speluncae]